MTFTGCESAFGREIAPGAHIVGPTRGALRKGGHSKSYLFEAEDGTLALVDTGWDADARVILGYLDDIGRSPRQLENIVLTHAHRSHLGGVARLKELTHATVSCHTDEAAIVEGNAKARRIKPWPPIPPVLFLFRIASWLPWIRHTACLVDRHLVDGDRVGPLTVIHTPGHTPGHLVLRYRGGVLAVGDAVATWPKFGPGWPGFNRDDDEYSRSLAKVVALSPSVVGPGHGEAMVDDTAARLRTLVTKA